MEISLILAEEVAKLFIVMAMGWALVKARVLRTEDSRVISAVLVYLVTPCVIIGAFQIEHSPQVTRGLVFSFAAAIGAHALFLLLAALFGRAMKLDTAERLTVVYATDALASGMECAGPEREVRFKAGGLPTLLRTGVFTVALRNRQAEKLQLYPLDLAGNRLKKIEPVAVEGDRAVFRVDTARDGVSLFFEVVAEK